MASLHKYDAIVIGAGPNGLAAAITLAQAGKSVAVFEADEAVGGSVRSAPLTLPGFVHDVCSTVYPLAVGSPFFRTLPLARHGLEWIEPPAALAHPFDDGSALVVTRCIRETAVQLGCDSNAYKKIFEPFAASWDALSPDLLAPLRWPRHPLKMARFGIAAFRRADRFAESRFVDGRTRALFAGLAAHSMLPLENWGTTAFALVLGIAAHALGWPIVRGGAQRLSTALCSYLVSLGGEVFCRRPVRSLADLPPCRAVLCDVTPRQLVNIAGARLPAGYRGALKRYSYGMAAFKIDWALSAAVPWRAGECGRAATVHLGATLPEIARSERMAWRGSHAHRPFVLLVQPSLFDQSRAPRGKHTLWAYCHVPNGSTFDMTDRIEAQIERFAPGFKQTILARHVSPPQRWSAAMPISSAAISTEARRPWRNCFSDRRGGCTPPLSRIFTSAPHRRRPAEECTVCAAISQRVRLCGDRSLEHVLRLPGRENYRDDASAAKPRNLPDRSSPGAVEPRFTMREER